MPELLTIERLTAGYISMQFGNERWTGNAGVRVIRTDVLSSGFNTPVTSIANTPGDDTLQYTYGPATPVSVPRPPLGTKVLPNSLMVNRVTRSATPTVTIAS